MASLLSCRGPNLLPAQMVNRFLEVCRNSIFLTIIIQPVENSVKVAQCRKKASVSGIVRKDIQWEAGFLWSLFYIRV